MAASTHGIELRSDALTVRLDPRLGGRITSLEDAMGFEYLARGGPPADTVGPGDDYLAGGLGGFDDCLPGITPEVLRAPDRIVPDHGEVWCRPVDVVATSSSRAVIQQTGIAGEHVLRRTLALEGHRLRIDYELENLRDTPYEALWAAHPLLPLTADCRLVLGGIEVVSVYASSFARHGESIGVGRAVLGDTEIDLTRPGTVPAGHTLKAFAPLPQSAQVGALYPARRTGLLLRLHTDRPAWLGLWLNTGGFPAHAPVKHVALEPSFGDGDSLSEAIGNGTCLRVPANECTTWALDVELVPVTSSTAEAASAHGFARASTLCPPATID